MLVFWDMVLEGSKCFYFFKGGLLMKSLGNPEIVDKDMLSTKNFYLR